MTAVNSNELKQLISITKGFVCFMHFLIFAFHILTSYKSLNFTLNTHTSLLLDNKPHIKIANLTEGQ